MATSYISVNILRRYPDGRGLSDCCHFNVTGNKIATSGHACNTCNQCVIVEYMAFEYPEWLVFV